MYWAGMSTCKVLGLQVKSLKILGNLGFQASRGCARGLTHLNKRPALTHHASQSAKHGRRFHCKRAFRATFVARARIRPSHAERRVMRYKIACLNSKDLPPIFGNSSTM